MSDLLEKEIHAYMLMEPELRIHHLGKFVVLKEDKLIGSFDSFDAAAKEAIKKFGKGPYLIRQVGRPTTMSMPSSVAFRPVHAPR